MGVFDLGDLRQRNGDAVARGDGEIADPAKIRVEAERAEAAAETIQPGVSYADPSTVDRIAIRRELVRLHGAAARAEAEAQRLQAALDAQAAELAALRQHLAEAGAPLGLGAAVSAVAAALRRRHDR